MNAGKRGIEKFIGSDGAKIADVIFQHYKKTQLLAVERMGLRERGEFGLGRFVFQTDDAAQDPGDRYGCIRKEFAQRG